MSKMRESEKQAVLSLVHEQLGQQHLPRWYRSEQQSYTATKGTDEERLVQDAVYYVLEWFYIGKFDFTDPTFERYSDREQGMLAIISEFLVDHRHTFELSEDMVARAKVLRRLIHLGNLPVMASSI